ncbi:exodeoxyribonuclease VII small subunit [Myxococcota bacterium]|nr:exodeoxyribonuclease VII small subunit [Myxococcota bacterium]
MRKQTELTLPDPAPAPAPDTAPGATAPSFEETLAQLEDHVRRLDAGDLPLEQALALFEQGVGLVRQCQDLLDTAERRIVELSEGPGGLEERPFDGGARSQD